MDILADAGFPQCWFSSILVFLNADQTKLIKPNPSSDWAWLGEVFPIAVF
jgi:hypothetical protein